MTDTALTPNAPRPETAGPGPLAGVRVVELGMLLAGPFTGRLLGDMGAEIIKVEAPGQPDPLREWGKARYQGRSLWWPVQSRNKKCVTLNLREERGQQLLLALVERSDVLVENFRPGTLERWQLGPEQLWEANPRLVIARISGYGQTGPYGPRAGFASVAEAMGGIRTSTASRASRRRGSTSPSATRSPACSPCRASSPRSTGATCSAAAAARWSTCR